MTTIAQLRSAVFSAIVLVLAGCTMPDPEVDKAREQIAPTLPAPYFEDLVTESVKTSGKRLVFLIRSPAGDADEVRGHPQFESLRQSEQGELRGLCALPGILPLVGTDAILVRRFVDVHDKPFFEVAMPAAECSRTPFGNGVTDAPLDPTQRSDP